MNVSRFLNMESFKGRQLILFILFNQIHMKLKNNEQHLTLKLRKLLIKTAKNIYRIT